MNGSVNNWYYDGQSEQLAHSPNLYYILTELATPLREEMRASDGQAKPSAEYSTGRGLEVDTTSYSYTDDCLTNGGEIGLGTIEEASVENLSNLLQTPDTSGVLVTRDDSGNCGYVELVYRFYTVTGWIGSVSASLTGSVAPHTQA